MFSPFRELKEIKYLVEAIKPRGLRPWGLIASTRNITSYSSLKGENNYIKYCRKNEKYTTVSMTYTYGVLAHWARSLEFAAKWQLIRGKGQ